MADDGLKNFNFDDDPDESGRKKWLPILGAALLVSALAGGANYLVQMMSGTAAPQQPLVQQISIVVPPPPPPPPPKIEEPEPEIEEIDIDEPEPEPLADDTSLDEALDDALGLDAEGAAGADGFGLKAKKGGRGLVGGDPLAWYAGILQSDLQSLLSDDDEVRGDRYSVIVNIWLSDDGYLESSELVRGTDDPALDAALRRALSQRVKLSQQPPDDLPQPIRIRITSRG